MSVLSFIPWELQALLALLALGGLLYFITVTFGINLARTVAIWGGAALAVLIFISRAFQRGQRYEIDRSNKAADDAISKANQARARADRDADSGRLRDDDGFQRRD